MARALAMKMRWEKQSQSRLKRSFSWSRGKKAPPKLGSAQKPARLGGLLSPRGAPSAGKPVKRASSFDRFMRKSSPKDPGGLAPAPAQPEQTFSKQLLFILLSRGPNGLGLELDAVNTVINVVKGGAADAQGYFRVDDTIASVDGIPLRGRLLQEVMDGGKSSYSFDVWRITRPDPVAPPKPDQGVKRALSFDRRRR